MLYVHMGHQLTTRTPSRSLYAAVKAGFVLQDTSLRAECARIGVLRESAYKCLTGRWTGPKAARLIDELCERSGGR